MNSYELFLRTTGEWIGAVHHVDSAAEAIAQWVDSFGGATGIVARMIRAERRPA